MLYYFIGLVVYHRCHPGLSFVVVSCCPCPRRILILFTSSLISSSLLSLSSSSRYVVVASFYRRLVVIFVCYLITAYWHVHLEDLVGPHQRYRAPRETSRHCAPQRSQTFAYGTRQRSHPFAKGRIGGVFSLGLKPFVNGSCMQTGGNIVRNRRLVIYLVKLKLIYKI